MKLILTCLIAALSFSTVGAHGPAGRYQTPRVQSLCGLVGDWKENHGQKVRVRAILVSGAEQTWLFDPTCREGASLTHVEFRHPVKGAEKRLDEILDKDRRAWVILEGVFYGPELRKDVDPGLPAPIRERLENSPKRYGHMDSFETMIEVLKVVKANEVSAPPAEQVQAKQQVGP